MADYRSRQGPCLAELVQPAIAPKRPRHAPCKGHEHDGEGVTGRGRASPNSYSTPSPENAARSASSPVTRASSGASAIAGAGRLPAVPAAPPAKQR